MQDTHTRAHTRTHSHTPTDIYRLIIHLRVFALLTSLCFSSQYVTMGKKTNLCVRRKIANYGYCARSWNVLNVCIECSHWRLPVLLSNAPSGLRPFFWYVKMRYFEKYMTLNATCEVFYETNTKWALATQRLCLNKSCLGGVKLFFPSAAQLSCPELAHLLPCISSVSCCCLIATLLSLQKCNCQSKQTISLTVI